MKWLLVVAVFGNTPVKTNLVFDSLRDCLVAEEAMRAEIAVEYNLWEAWAKIDPKAAFYPESSEFQKTRIGIRNQGTCIPHANTSK